MKKIIVCVLGLINFMANAQFSVSTKTLDLESLKLQKGFQMYSGYKNSNGEYVIKMGRPKCESSKSFGASYVEYEFRGLSWDFEELIFNNDMTFKGSEKKSFESTIDALAYEPVWGKRFFPFESKAAFLDISSEWIGKKSVVFDLVGSKASIEGFYPKIVGGADKNGAGCAELPSSKTITSTGFKSAKGQGWGPAGSHSYIGGGTILYLTTNVYPDGSKLHYIMKKLNDSAAEVAEAYIPFDFYAMGGMLTVDKGNGKFDYIVLVQALERNKYIPKELPIKGATTAELVYVDGETMQIKFREKFEMPYTLWKPYAAAMGTDGSVYVMGPCGKDNKTVMPVVPVENSPEKLPNFQVLKIKDSKIASISGVSNAEAAAVTTTLSHSAIKTKGSSKVVFTMPFGIVSAGGSSLGNQVAINKKDYKTYFKADKMITIFQTYEGVGKVGNDRGNMVALVFDLNGKLLRHIIKPESEYSNSNEFFSPDGKTLYWACYELSSLNEPIFEGGTFLPKKVKNMVAANLHMAKINLDNFQASIEPLGTDNWALNAASPVVCETDQEIIFSGRQVSSKAKDSELVLVKVLK